MSHDVRRSKRTQRIEDLIRKVGTWDEADIAAVREIIGESNHESEEIEAMGKDPNDYPTEEAREARRQQYTIEGEWSDPPVTELRLDASPEIATGRPMSPAPASSQEERIASLERTVALLWKAIAALEEKIGVGKDGGT